MTSSSEGAVVIPPPPRPLNPTARAVYGRLKASEQMRLFYALIPVMVAGLVLLPSTFLLRSAVINVLIDWNIRAKTVPGSVMAKHKSRSQRVQGRSYSLYGVRYQYTYNNKSYRNIQFVWEPDSKPSFKVGQPLRVEFSAYIPKFSRIAGLRQMKDNTNIMLYLVLFLLVSLLAMSGYWLVRALKPWWRRRRLYKHGIAVRALVTEVDQDTDVQVSGQHPIRLNWRYKIDGQEYTGAYSTMRMSELNAMSPPGSEMAVLTHPKHPDQSLPFLPERNDDDT